MPALIKQVGWALTIAATIIATPMQAAAHSTEGSDRAATTTAMQQPTLSQLSVSPSATARWATPSANTPTTTTQAEPESGRGWAELYCMTCVGIGSFALYSGGISMLPLLLGQPQTVSTLVGSCLLACQSAIKSMLK